MAAATLLIDGIYFDGPVHGQEEIEHKLVPLLLVALILGVVTSFVKPVLTVLSIPFIVITLGLFLLVINAAMLLLTSWLADKLDIGFHVDRLLAGGRRRHRDHGGHLDRRQRDRGVPIAPALPAPRTPGRYAVAMVCLGNICRSPMADVVLSQRVDDAGLAGRVTVTSCGTGDWHVGRPMDERAAATLRANDYDPSAHRAQQFVAVVAGGQRPGARDGRHQPRRRTPRRSVIGWRRRSRPGPALR